MLFVNILSLNEKLAIKKAMMISRVIILLIRYKTTIDPTGRREAITVPNTTLNRVILF